MKAREYACYLSEKFSVCETLWPESLIFLLTEFADDYDIERRNAASVTHIFMRDCLKIKDIQNAALLKEAEALCDLYDCRVCVNSITQVFIRKLMLPMYKLESGRPMFGGRETFDISEAESIAGKIKRIYEDK